MGNCEFSEKFYEILFDRELLNKLRNLRIYVPSQAKEKFCGYDSLIHLVKSFPKAKFKFLALQFKVPQKYKTIRAPYCKNAYKFILHKDSANKYSQHNKLVKMNMLKKYGVFYVVPKFNTFDELYKVGFSDIMNNSLFIVPANNIHDNEFHYINYGQDSSSKWLAQLHSKSTKNLVVYEYAQFFEQIQNIPYVENFESIKEYFNDSDFRWGLYIEE